MSHEPSDPADTPPGEKSCLSSSKEEQRPKKKWAKNWDKQKVFAKPEFQLPFHLGRRGSVPVWLQVAVDSGLVETGSPHEGYRGGPYIDIPEDAKPFDQVMKEAMAKELERLEKQKK